MSDELCTAYTIKYSQLCSNKIKTRISMGFNRYLNAIPNRPMLMAKNNCRDKNVCKKI